MTKPSIPLFDRNRDHPSVPQGAGDTAANFSSIKRKELHAGLTSAPGWAAVSSGLPRRLDLEFRWP